MQTNSNLQAVLDGQIGKGNIYNVVALYIRTIGRLILPELRVSPNLNRAKR